MLEGGCVQVGTEGLPFGPLIEALRGLSARAAAGGARRVARARAAPSWLASCRTFSARGDDCVRRRAARQLGAGPAVRAPAAALRTARGAGAAVVVIEDVHWADRSTLELLGFLGRNLRHGPIAPPGVLSHDELHRRHPLLPFLAEQERSGRAERLELARFDRAELAAQLAAILGAQPDPELVERIAARSQGNAFYAEELLAAEPPPGAFRTRCARSSWRGWRP